jgi:hypothetical protein
MKTVSIFLMISLCAWGTQLMTGGADSNGVSVSYETRLEPPSPPIQQHGGGTLTENQTIKRHICNFDNNTYFGYDLTLRPLQDGRFEMVFAPLSITPAKMSEIFPKVKTWTLLQRPNGPATMDVRAGETVALDLFSNPSTGQKVTDYLTIKGKGGRTSVAVRGPARDFTPEDALIEISSPEVTVDGRKVTSGRGSVSGESVWIDLPGHGRFVFSLAARTDLGMQKAGEIRGSAMTWRASGHDYRIDADKPIVSGSRAYNVYVFHIPRTAEYFGMAGGPSAEAPIRNR